MSTADDANQVGRGWEGWEAYQQFARSVQQSLRYVRWPATEQFLTDVLASSGPRKRPVPKGTFYWRARLGCETEHVGTDVENMYECERPYEPDGFKPIPNLPTEGRANPLGVPHLYLATSMETAAAEVRPWIGAKISVAQFEIKRDLIIIDCSVYHSVDILPRVYFDASMPRESGIWAAIDRAFATPVTRDEGGEYIPTQIIAEMFKREKLDGIVYKSLLSEDGFNLVLFNLSDADVVSSSLYSATKLHFKFEQMTADFLVRGDAAAGKK